MPQIQSITENQAVSATRSLVPPNSNNLEIVVVISNILNNVNLEIGGFNTTGLVYSQNDGGENDALQSYNTIQES
jgi:hypothetical protein